DLVAVNELRVDLRQSVGGEERQEVELERPTEVGDRPRSESFRLTPRDPLRRELVERRLLLRWFRFSRERRLPDAASDVRKHEGELRLSLLECPRGRRDVVPLSVCPEPERERATTSA